MAPQSCEVFQTLVWWGGERHKPSPRHHTNICKISQFAELYLHLLETYHFQIKLPVILIVTRFFQWCPRCFPNWSMSKVKNRGSSKAKNGILFDWKVMLILSLKDFINMCYECKCIFSCFIDNNNRNKKKKITKEHKTTTATPVLKFTSSCCLFVFVFSHSTALPDHISERFQRATKCGKFSRAVWEFNVVLNSR